VQRKEIALIKETRKSELVPKIMDTIAPYLTIPSNARVAIKISLAGSKEIYANTNYKTVDSLIAYLREKFSVSSIHVVEGADGALYSGKSTWEIFYKFKYKEVELHDVRLVNLDDLDHNRRLSVQTLAGLQEISFVAYEADYLISVVPPKTHYLFPVSLAIPSLCGFVKPEDRALMYGVSFAELKKLNSFSNEKFSQICKCAAQNFVSLLKQIPISLVVIDGLYGMEGKGPIKGSPVFHGFSIASEDPILADSLTTYVMGFDEEDVPYLNLAYREGLGYNRWQNVIGVDPPHVRFPYRPHPLFQRQRKWREANHNQSHEGEPNDRGGKSGSPH